MYKSLWIALLVISIPLIGCAPLKSASQTVSIIPVSGANDAFQVHEFALIEASADNPDHVEFQGRARSAVAASRSAWPFVQTEYDLKAPNEILAPFEYKLAPNPTPPFSGFALYSDGQLVQGDIARFWPVEMKNTETGDKQSDFLLSFETMDGERLVASVDGVHPWPDQGQSAGGIPYASIGNQLVYANNTGSAANIYTATLADIEESPPVEMFGWQIVAEQPFYFYTSGDLVHLNYAGQDLAYVYDQVVYNRSGQNAIFNPGTTGQVAWFYGLRDGLWYYVEAGIFQ